MVVTALREQQHELGVVRRQFLADAPELECEERVGEDSGLRLGDHHGDRVVAPGDEAAGGLVGHVPEFFDGPAHPFDERLTDSVPTVHDARHGGPGDPGPRGHGLQRGSRRCLGHVRAPPRRMRIRIAA
jgi:ABC-type dipeptide/oligopeptide/nickel transport system, ATPase component